MLTAAPARIRVRDDRCIAALGPDCGACAGVCPDGTNALRLVDGRPHIDDESCTGCGECVRACPTTPKAIVLRTHDG